MGKKKLEQANRENIVAETVNTDDTESSSPTKFQDGGTNANPSTSDATSLTKVLQEIRDFRKDTKEQLSAIQLEIANVNQKIAEHRSESTKWRNVSKIWNRCCIR